MRHSRALLAAGITVATLAAGAGTAYAGMGKTVTVTVDGSRHHLHTFAGTVSGALAAAGVHYSGHDLVVPAASSSLHRGAQITVRHARELSLTIDGQQRDVWVLADSVGTALDQLGLGNMGAVVSASRSRPIPLSGLALTLRLPHDVTLIADHKTRHLVTTAPTVAGLLTQAKIRLAKTDKVSVPLTTYPADGSTIRVTRIRTKTVSNTSRIGYATVRHSTSSLYKGTSQVERAGHPGQLRRTYRVTYVDGKVKSRTLVATKTTTQPQSAIVLVGTKSRPVVHYSAPAPAPAPASSSSSSSSHSGSGYGGLNWSALANCESGGNPRAVNPTGTYRGLYQFSISTWQSVGGSGDPINASAGEQTYRAWLLYQRAGSSPWPVCGRYL